MRIITRKEFMEMPAGTVFSYYEPCIFRELNIKDSEPEKGYPDFSYSSIIGAFECSSSDEFSQRCELMEKGESFPSDFEFSGREGLFDHTQLYAVYEKGDVEKLIKRLQDTLTNK
jgi:hypothetical protein